MIVEGHGFYCSRFSMADAVIVGDLTRLRLLDFPADGLAGLF